MFSRTGKIYTAYITLANIVSLILALTSGIVTAFIVLTILGAVGMTVIFIKYGKKKFMNGTWMFSPEYLRYFED